MMAKQEHIRVFCRLRGLTPEDQEGGDSSSAFFTGSQQNEESCFDSFDEKSGECTYHRDASGGGESKKFRFDGLLGANTPQEDVYAAVGGTIVSGCLDGFNGAILAYGQTGSGKTYSMRGEATGHAMGLDRRAGIIPRALAQLFDAQRAPGADVTLSLSCVQIYCEMLQDLLEPDNGQSLTIRENGKGGSLSGGDGNGSTGKGGGVFVEGLARVPVESLEECLSLLGTADQNRTVCATRLNAQSSRSHACYVIHVERRVVASPPTGGGAAGGGGGAAMVLRSTLTLVDLAGSERVKKSGVQYQAFEETKAINLSLSALGNCVSSLAQGRDHVPFRDSKLTRLLQPSLGGTARTALLCTLAPGGDAQGENWNSLQFAVRAGRCKVASVRNELSLDYEALYRGLLKVVDRKDDSLHASELQCAELQAKLNQQEARASQFESERDANAELLARAKAGYGASIAVLDSSSSENGEGGGEQAVAAVEAVNERWRCEMDSLATSHGAQVAELKGRWEKQLEAYKQAATTANAEWGVSENELTQERKAYLETLQSHRELKERTLTLEKEQSARVGELLGEVAGWEAKEQELVEALSSAQRTADLSLSKAAEMASRLESLESTHANASSALDHDFVSRTQVEAMDGLFKQTVERLSERLEVLAEQNKQLSQEVSAGQREREAAVVADRGRRMDPKSRAVLSDMERQHNPLRGGGGGDSGGGGYNGGGGGGRARKSDNDENDGRWARPSRGGLGNGGGGGGGGGGISRGVKIDGGGGGRGVRIEPGRLRAGGGGGVPDRRRF